MDMKQVRYFLSVADTLNFTQAAEQNAISQPALTRSIQKLEEEFGGNLIVRDGKNTRLTGLGLKIRREFATMFESEVRARELASDHLNAGHRVLNIGVANSMGPRMFSGFWAEFLNANPNTRIILHAIDQETSEEAILSGMLDACICTRRPNDNPKLKTTLLFNEKLLLAFARNDAFASQSSVSVEEFLEEKYFDRLNCEFRPSFLAMVEDQKLDVQPLMQSDREDWIQQMVAEGHGVCTLGEYSAVVPGIRMRPIDGIDMERAVSMTSIFGSGASDSIIALEKFAKSYGWKARSKG